MIGAAEMAGHSWTAEMCDSLRLERIDAAVMAHGAVEALYRLADAQAACEQQALDAEAKGLHGAARAWRACVAGLIEDQRTLVERHA